MDGRMCWVEYAVVTSCVIPDLASTFHFQPPPPLPLLAPFNQISSDVSPHHWIRSWTLSSWNLL